MTIMFQLFSARDLQKLTRGELDELKNIAIEAMLNESKDKKLQDIRNSINGRAGQKKPVLPALILKRTRGTDPVEDNISQGNSMLKKRLNEVRQQLLDSRESAPYDPESFTKAIEPQRDSDGREKLDEKEQEILAWAVSCERNFIEFYAPLRRARELAYEYFLEKTGQRPEGPDSSYSPFSSDHPLRRRSPGLYDY